MKLPFKFKVRNSNFECLIKVQQLPLGGALGRKIINAERRHFYSPQIPMNMAKNTVPTLSNRCDC